MLTALPVLVTSLLVMLGTQLAGSAPHAVPGRIRPRTTDLGGAGVAYADSAAGNNGATYRSDNVDIKSVPDGSIVVGWFQSGEWLAYAVNVAQDGVYDVRLRTGSAYTPARTLVVAIDDSVVGQVQVPTIADWDSPLAVATLKGVSLTAGPTSSE